MPLVLVQDAPGLLGGEGLVQAGPVVRVQVVLDQPDLRRLGVMDVHQLPDAQGVVAPGAPRGHLDVAPAPQRLAHHHLATHPLALVLVVHPGVPARLGRLGLAHLAEELLAGLVEADHREQRVVGQKVRLDHVFHPPDELGVGLGRQAPGLDDPRLDVVFFSAWRTVSGLIFVTRPSTTSLSASSSKVQRQRPSGGSLQARRTNSCSRSPLILILPGRGGCFLRARAAWRPSVTNSLRTRAMVRGPTPRAATMSSSQLPCAVASASRRMRAWVNLRAAALPTETSRCKPVRSSAVRATRYLSIVVLAGSMPGRLPECHLTGSTITC